MHLKAIISLTTTLLPALTSANFHIFQSTNTVANKAKRAAAAEPFEINWENLQGITLAPDYDMGCYSAVNGPMCDNEEELTTPAQWYLSFPTGICDSGPLDFYRADEWGGYHYYKAGGDGTEIGKCYPTGGCSTCVVGLGAASACQLFWCDGLC